MFKQIETMLEPGAALALSVTKEKDGRLRVAVRPIGDFKNSVLGQGIAVTESAEELDAQFGSVLSQYQVAHLSLKDQVDDRLRVMAAAAEAEKLAKTEATKKGAAPKTGVKVAGKATATVAAAVQGEDLEPEAEDLVDGSGGAGEPLKLF